MTAAPVRCARLLALLLAAALLTGLPSTVLAGRQAPAAQPLAAISESPLPAGIILASHERNPAPAPELSAPGTVAGPDPAGAVRTRALLTDLPSLRLASAQRHYTVP